MTTNTKPNSSVNPNAPVAAPKSSEGTGKPTITMGTAQNALIGLQALAACYREFIDLDKDLRIKGIDTQQNFSQQMWQKAIDSAEDSRNALFMQGATSIAGGLLSGANAVANAKTSSTAKQEQIDAEANKDFCKGLKTKLETVQPDAALEAGNHAGADTFAHLEEGSGTKEAVRLLKGSDFDELRIRNGLPATNNLSISDAELRDAVKFVRADVDGINHADVLKKLDDHVGMYTSEGLQASNKIAQQDALNRNMVDLAKGFVDSGLQVGQALYTQKSRQEEADATRLSQAQKMAEQYQSDLDGAGQNAARDLRSISEQIGRIVPQRG